MVCIQMPPSMDTDIIAPVEDLSKGKRKCPHFLWHGILARRKKRGRVLSHIEFNKTDLNCDGKFQNVKDSAFFLRKLNDELCRAYGLSVIENPKPSAKK